jgi:hypothetical protein
MILLHERTRPKPQYVPQTIRLVFFKSGEDILGVLSSHGATEPSTLRREAVPFIPMNIAQAANEDPLDQAQLESEEREEAYEETDNTQVAGELPASSINVYSTNLVAPPSEEMLQAARVIWNALRHYIWRRRVKEFHAARIIQRIYRRKISRKRAGPKTGAAAARARHVATCLAHSQETAMPRGLYRCLFLGALPHLLFCMGHIQTYAQEAKTRYKKQFQSSMHDHLIESSKRLTEVK